MAVSLQETDELREFAQLLGKPTPTTDEELLALIVPFIGKPSRSVNLETGTATYTWEHTPVWLWEMSEDANGR